MFCRCFQICADHVENSVDAANHYKAVCRALVAEAVELSTFLDRIYDEREASFLPCCFNQGSKWNGTDRNAFPIRQLRRFHHSISACRISSA